MRRVTVQGGATDQARAEMRAHFFAALGTGNQVGRFDGDDSRAAVLALLSSRDEFTFAARAFDLRRQMSAAIHTQRPFRGELVAVSARDRHGLILTVIPKLEVIFIRYPYRAPTARDYG